MPTSSFTDKIIKAVTLVQKIRAGERKEQLAAAKAETARLESEIRSMDRQTRRREKVETKQFEAGKADVPLIPGEKPFSFGKRIRKKKLSGEERKRRKTLLSGARKTDFPKLRELDTEFKRLGGKGDPERFSRAQLESKVSGLKEKATLSKTIAREGRAELKQAAKEREREGRQRKKELRARLRRFKAAVSRRSTLVTREDEKGKKVKVREQILSPEDRAFFREEFDELSAEGMLPDKKFVPAEYLTEEEQKQVIAQVTAENPELAGAVQSGPGIMTKLPFGIGKEATAAFEIQQGAFNRKVLELADRFVLASKPEGTQPKQILKRKAPRTIQRSAATGEVSRPTAKKRTLLPQRIQSRPTGPSIQPQATSPLDPSQMTDAQILQGLGIK